MIFLTSKWLSLIKQIFFRSVFGESVLNFSNNIKHFTFLYKLYGKDKINKHCLYERQNLMSKPVYISK